MHKSRNLTVNKKSVTVQLRKHRNIKMTVAEATEAKRTHDTTDRQPSAKPSQLHKRKCTK